MTDRRTLSTLGVVAAAVVAVLIGSGLRAGAVEHSAAHSVDRWADRLEALAPDVPIAYLELAEEIDDERAVGPAAGSDPVAAAERRLVIELYRLAGRLDRSLAPSAARALADLARLESDRRRLRAVAELLEGDRLLRARAPGSQRYADDASGGSLAVRVMVSRAISLIRLGRGSEASELISAADPDVVEVALATWPGGLRGFLEDCERAPSDPTRDALLRQLATETVVLAGDRADWSAIARSGTGDPVAEIDLDRVDELFGSGQIRPWWRDGTWTDDSES